ncbi:MAG: metallopeptidase family protein [Deltaproteobacteria bacterium]|nr:metallopeptidase family protein [Deltaproteobacteria bacterium]
MGWEESHLVESYHLWRRMSLSKAVDVHFDLGLAAYDRRDLDALKKQRAAIAMLPEAGVDSLEHMALDWRTRWLEGREEEALAIARRVVELHPDDADSVLELAQILNDLDRGHEAVEVLRGAVERAPEDSDLWFELGYAAERLEQWELRQRAFYEVWRIEHDRPPRHRLFLPDQPFVDAVEATLEKLPAGVRSAIGNVAIMVEDYPDEWVVAEGIADPRILGLFDGPTHAGEGATASVHEGPARIYIYRWNIERQCASADEGEEQVEITVLHEIGHYLGLDEDALHARGLG